MPEVCEGDAVTPRALKPRYVPNYDTATPEDLASVPWGTYTEARQECFMALSETEYTYGAGRGIRTYKSIAFLPWVERIRQTLNLSPKDGIPGQLATEYSGNRCTYNVCFLNRYEDAGQHLGWHSDDSPGMNHEHPIAVVSFGQARQIWWRKSDHKGEIPADQRQLLEHGSLFVMPAGFQREHQHKIPKGDRKMQPRASLTFRHYIPELGDLGAT